MSNAITLGELRHNWQHLSDDTPITVHNGWDYPATEISFDRDECVLVIYADDSGRAGNGPRARLSRDR